MTNFIQVDMTSIPATWDNYSISLAIDAGLVGQILQFGFANTATNYEGIRRLLRQCVVRLPSPLAGRVSVLG